MAKADILRPLTCTACHGSGLAGEERIVLELTREEAEAMQVVFARVGGSPDRSPRGRIENISDALAPHVGSALQLQARYTSEGRGADDRGNRSSFYFRHPGDKTTV